MKYIEYTRPVLNDVLASHIGKSHWSPMLDHPTKGVVLSIISSICKDLEDSLELVEDVSLSQGLAGIALFFANYYVLKGDFGIRKMLCRILDKIFKRISSEPMIPWLFGGFLGVGWALERIGILVEDVGVDESTNSELDSIAVELLGASKWGHSFDLVIGLVGIGVYALHRRDKEMGARIYSLVEAQLTELVESDAVGMFWRTRPPFLSPFEEKTSPAGVRNLGMAHGIPGVISMLAAGCANGYGRASSKTLLSEAVNWLLSQQRVEKEGSFFSTTAEVDAHARCAWCYGDAGICISLLRAGEVLGRSDVVSIALSLGHSAAMRSLPDTGVIEPTICHGAAGLMHIYNRMYQKTKDARMRQAFQRWLGITLSFRVEGEGIGGFKFRDRAETISKPDAGLLTGSAGIGLALLSAFQQPHWDQVFLVDC